MVGRKAGTPKTGGRAAGTLNKDATNVRSLASVYTADCLKTLVNIVQRSKNEGNRIAAARELLDRATYGTSRPLGAEGREARCYGK